ncbi:hypothetical protein COO91_02622 [Nostoc flagelliforme CCNUN1]|uniref:Uncharacterized protein n=2 Tax=Nostoc flagelliforme TaxID=1306274 RepID=A0A2K8SMP6_9NOSO|nr:hypothetical protein [Nostoc flagelliforme]AUB36701.1 hypothetical protein COO91_02622 [Nostoc flagelliforme CCNUN1]
MGMGHGALGHGALGTCTEGSRSIGHSPSAFLTLKYYQKTLPTHGVFFVNVSVGEDDISKNE